MNAFLEFRMWLRRGPAAERAATAVSAVLLLALVAWAVVPTGSGTTAVGTFAQSPGGPPVGDASAGAGGDATSSSGVPVAGAGGTGGGSGGATASVATGGGSGSVATGGGEAATDGQSSQQAAAEGGCIQGSTDPGVSDTEIRIAVTTVNVFGANDTINVPSADEQQAMYEAMFDSINQAGGIQCRALVANFYEMNPLDQSSQRSGCLRIAEDGNFALVGAGGFFPQSEALCVPQQGIPLFATYGLLPSMQEQYYPYVFSSGARVDQTMHTWVLGARDQGFFDPAAGFVKLGVFENNCDPEVGSSLLGYLEEIGIPGSSISRFVADCPLSGQTPPSQCTQAALQHKLDGVTHVLLNAGASPNNCYVNNAARQDFRPRYSTSDYVLGISPHTVGEAPNPGAFDGALGITLSRMGHFNSGLPPEAGSEECNAWLTSHGFDPVVAENATGLLKGSMCGSFQLFLAAVSGTPSLRRADLAAGLGLAGQRAFSWPAADAVFDRPDKVTGSDFYRVVHWHADCACWKVDDPAFKPAVPG